MPATKAKPKTQSKFQSKQKAKTQSAVKPAHVHKPESLALGVHRLTLSSTNPVRGETKTLAVDQPCRLLGAVVVMQGAASGQSSLGLDIDGRLLHVATAHRVVSQALTMPNPSGVFATHASYGNTWTVVFGWAQPISVYSGARVMVQIGEDVAELDMSLVIETV